MLQLECQQLADSEKQCQHKQIQQQQDLDLVQPKNQGMITLVNWDRIWSVNSVESKDVKLLPQGLNGRVGGIDAYLTTFEKACV